MLEKLSEYEITNRDGSFINVDCNTKIINTLVRKINNLVDAVNEIMTWRFETDEDSDWYDDPKHREQPSDPYAEQRKWNGCLVEYGNAEDGFKYGILTNIEPIFSAYPFEIDNGRDATANCWLPSKTIFYKGGNNE